jgi:hypothetical protein
MRIFVLAILAAGCANSATIQFLTLPADVENGTYNGYVGAEVNNIETMIVCDDFADKTYVPSGPWQYAVTSLSGDLSETLYGSPTTYEAIATLAWEGLNDPDQIAEYQYAIWQATNSSVAPYEQSAALLAAARSQPANQTVLDNFLIYTPIGSATGNQEFVGFGSEAPEAKTFLTVLAGLIALAWRGNALAARVRSFLGRLAGENACSTNEG